MSGLSNFLGNVYGENEEPNDGAAPTEADQPQQVSYEDVRDSMDALLADTEEGLTDTDAVEADGVAADGEPASPQAQQPDAQQPESGSATSPDVSADEWPFADDPTGDTPNDATPTATVDEAATAAAPEVDDWFAGIDDQPSPTPDPTPQPAFDTTTEGSEIAAPEEEPPADPSNVDGPESVEGVEGVENFDSADSADDWFAGIDEPPAASTTSDPVAVVAEPSDTPDAEAAENSDDDWFAQFEDPSPTEASETEPVGDQSEVPEDPGMRTPDGEGVPNSAPTSRFLEGLVANTTPPPAPESLLSEDELTADPVQAEVDEPWLEELLTVGEEAESDAATADDFEPASAQFAGENPENDSDDVYEQTESSWDDVTVPEPPVAPVAPAAATPTDMGPLSIAPPSDPGQPPSHDSAPNSEPIDLPDRAEAPVASMPAPVGPSLAEPVPANPAPAATVVETSPGAATHREHTVPTGPWEAAYDDIVPGKFTAAAAVRLVTEDQSVTGALQTSTERRKGRRGRRAADDPSNPVVSTKPTNNRRRSRRRRDDSSIPQQTDELGLPVLDPNELPSPAPTGMPGELTQDEFTQAGTPIDGPAVAPIDLPPPSNAPSSGAPAELPPPVVEPVQQLQPPTHAAPITGLMAPTDPLGEPAPFGAPSLQLPPPVDAQLAAPTLQPPAADFPAPGAPELGTPGPFGLEPSVDALLQPPPTSDAALVSPSGPAVHLPPPVESGDADLPLLPPLPEPESGRKERRRGLLGRRSNDDARNELTPQPEPKQRRRRGRRRSDDPKVIADPVDDGAPLTDLSPPISDGPVFDAPPMDAPLPMEPPADFGVPAGTPVPMDPPTMGDIGFPAPDPSHAVDQFPTNAESLLPGANVEPPEENPKLKRRARRRRNRD